MGSPESTLLCTVTPMKKPFFGMLMICLAASARAGDMDLQSPAQQRMAAAQKVLQQQPKRFQAYNDLALALIRRTRESGDPSFYPRAESAVESSLQIQPSNFEAAQAHVALLLAEHQFHEALEEARALNRRAPDAVLVWGDVAEAEAALGDYQQAEEAAQWMMNLRPGNVPAYLTAAALREDWGDVDGALDFFEKALQQTPPLETEETAWILTRMASLHRQAGRLPAANSYLHQALKDFPDYYLATEEIAKLRIAQHAYPEALEMLTRLMETDKNPSLEALAAQTLERAGRQTEADKMWAGFERDAVALVSQPDNDNVDLIDYDVDHAHRPREALRVARVEIARRHDVRAVQAYAWALEANGQHDEARRQIEKALAVGTRDAALYYHAGVIEAAAGNKAAALDDWQQSMGINPTSDVADAARRAVAASPNYTAVRYAQ